MKSIYILLMNLLLIIPAASSTSTTTIIATQPATTATTTTHQQQNVTSSPLLSSISASLSSSSSPSSSSSSSLSLSSSSPSAASVIKNTTKICPGVHIRNDLKSFEQLKGCNIIDGPLTIALISNQAHPYESKDYENITFPELREVVDYLLFFRVQGLSTLSGLFPNLAIIRGNNPMEGGYALIIYEMMHLQKINLPNLTDILSGSVRIESNPNLCYIDTVNWEGICKKPYSPHFIQESSRDCKDHCPEDCPPWKVSFELNRYRDNRVNYDYYNRTSFCWSNQQCQELCTSDDSVMALPSAPGGGCCHKECAGGCYESARADRCFSCRHLIEEGRCREVCRSGLFEYKERCITREECHSTVQLATSSQCGQSSSSENLVSNLKAIDSTGKCQSQCPSGSEEDPSNKNECKPCDRGKCRKVCTPPQGSDKPFMVTNVNSLKELSGCNVINGSLEISIKGGKNVLHELETAFRELEEIKGFLKITRCYPILTLGFLSRLKAINGSYQDRGQYSLIIIDNPNLQELFIYKTSAGEQKQLNILEGKIFVHLNPKLCPHRIENLKTYASVSDWDERDVSIHTNGDKEACNTEKLEVQFIHGTARMAMIRFQNFALRMEDPRSLLYYLVNYREVAEGNVTMFDGRDGCNSQNDVWSTKEVSPIETRPYSNKTDKHQEIAINVKPSTRYALYVKTFTMLAGSTGALSDIIYFSTAPDTPGIPREIHGVAKSHDIVLISWSPPSKPNGVIEHYIITITQIPELEDIQRSDVCDSVGDREEITQAHSKNEPSLSVFEPPRFQNTSTNNNDNSPKESNSCSKTTSDADVDAQAEVVSFQDLIIDIVYLKQPCSISNSSKTQRRRKRASAEYEFISSAESSPLSIQRTSNQPSLLSSESIPTIQISRPIVNKITSPQTIQFNRTIGKTEVNLTASAYRSDTKMSYTIKDLEHFSLYTIEVVACHKDFKGIRTKPSADYHRCSLQAITQLRTMPLEENDRVLAGTIKFNPANDSTSEHSITWGKPERPNGLILAYKIRYRPKNGNTDIWTEGCLNNTAQNRFVLSDISPGAYLFSIQAVTMSPKKYWSEPELEIEIPQNHFMSPAVLAILIVFSIFLIAFSVAFGTYYYQRKRHELTNGLVYASVNPDYIQYDPDEWEVDKSNLIIGDHVGTGAFGMVYKGQLISEKGTLKCAIKTVPPTSTAKQRMDFLREASIMKQFDTFHVVKLMGVVSTTNPVYVIMEFMENGDLKSFLRSQREAHQKEKKTLVDGIYLMAAQIADGMAYLVSKKFVHRDLAARNCMVGENQVVKIGDFGLTRDIYVNDYYRRDTHGRLPVRWMAPESLLDNLYTSASDVWSFGIVVWEIVTFSAYPYQGQSNDEVIKRVSAGFTMSRPENCPDKLYNIMQRCWRKEQNERPTFTEIVEELLPEIEDKLFPNCFYKKNKTDTETNIQPSSEENNSGAESYPLLSWTSNRINGLTNGVSHIQSDTV